MRTANRIGLTLAVIALPLVATWLLFAWDSPVSTAILYGVVGFGGWAFSRTIQPWPWRRRREGLRRKR